ncbi:hypothetical protein QYF36_003081 [Acer negundo]|nr:hypothetical protein QYF36_003081 [Acer negundo]
MKEKGMGNMENVFEKCSGYLFHLSELSLAAATSTRMDSSSHHSSGTHAPQNNHSIRHGRNSENRPTPYETGRHRRSRGMDNARELSIQMGNARGFSIQFSNVQTAILMIGPEPVSPPPANRFVDLPAHAARSASSGTRHSSVQISNDDGGGVTGVRISRSLRAGNNPQQRDTGLNGEPTHAAGSNISPATAPAPAPAPAPAQPEGFGNVLFTHTARRGSSTAGYHQQPQDTGTSLSYIGGHTVVQTHAPGPYIGPAPFPHTVGYTDDHTHLAGLDQYSQALDVGNIDLFHEYGGFTSSAQMNAGGPGGSLTPRPNVDGVQTHAVPGSSRAGYLQPTPTAPPPTDAQHHSLSLWDNYQSQGSEKRF